MMMMVMVGVCIAGMLEATSGDVVVEGMDTREHIQDVRKIMGFCPQCGMSRGGRKEEAKSRMGVFVVDILYGELSVKEHLELVGKVCTQSETDPFHHRQQIVIYQSAITIDFEDFGDHQ